MIPRPEWLALLGRARLYVNASRFEDHGIAPLEALSAGAALVSLPTPGPYPALRMARQLAPALVSADLAAALRAGAALRDREDYARRADALLAPHRVEAMRRTMSPRFSGARAQGGGHLTFPPIVILCAGRGTW